MQRPASGQPRLNPRAQPIAGLRRDRSKTTENAPSLPPLFHHTVTGTGYVERPGLAAWASYHPFRWTAAPRGQGAGGVCVMYKLYDALSCSTILGGLECDEKRVERRAECPRRAKHQAEARSRRGRDGEGDTSLHRHEDRLSHPTVSPPLYTRKKPRPRSTSRPI